MRWTSPDRDPPHPVCHPARRSSCSSAVLYPPTGHQPPIRDARRGSTVRAQMITLAELGAWLDSADHAISLAELTPITLPEP